MKLHREFWLVTLDDRDTRSADQLPDNAASVGEVDVEGSSLTRFARAP